MLSTTARRASPAGAGAPVEAIRQNRPIIACLDRSRHAGKVLSHARALAAALKAPLTLLRVIEPPPDNEFHPDPVDWAIRRREADCALKSFARRSDGDALPRTDTVLAEGPCGEGICDEAQKRGAEIVVLGTRGESGERGDWHDDFGSTAREVMARAHSMVLFVPARAAEPPRRYRRILVPLDSSPWSETALPIALRLARATRAELVLAQAVTTPELVSWQPFEAEDIELRHRIVQRNKCVARTYLERQSRALADQGVAVRVLVPTGPDARCVLSELMQKEAFDLVVISARGNGCISHSELPYGNVVAHLASHGHVPLLVLPPHADIYGNHRGAPAHPDRRPAVRNLA